MTPPVPAGKMPLPDSVVSIAQRLEAAGFETWCVGGALRDWLLTATRPPEYEVDLATAARPEEVRQLFPRSVAVGAKYGTVGVLDERDRLHEVTTFRKDVATDGRHAVVEFGVSIEADLHRRDFTINAMAYHPPSERWLDPEGGYPDLQRGLLRAVGDPSRRFMEDYLRILRMVRFAARFRFQIDPATWAAAKSAAPGLRHLSAERVRDEWVKGLVSAHSKRQLVELWREVGAAELWLPELRDPYPYADPIRMLPFDPVVATAGLCERPGEVLRRLRASNAEISRAEAIGRAPQEPPAADVVSVRRWLARVGDAADDLLHLAELRTGAVPAWAEMVQGIRKRGEATARSQLALTGDDLVAAGVAPGPQLGQLLGRLLEAVLEDPSLNSKELLLQRVAAWR